MFFSNNDLTWSCFLRTWALNGSFKAELLVNSRCALLNNSLSTSHSTLVVPIANSMQEVHSNASIHLLWDPKWILSEDIKLSSTSVSKAFGWYCFMSLQRASTKVLRRHQSSVDYSRCGLYTCGFCMDISYISNTHARNLVALRRITRADVWVAVRSSGRVWSRIVGGSMDARVQWNGIYSLFHGVCCNGGYHLPVFLFTAPSCNIGVVQQSA